jgi:hypothetical protein
VCVCSLGYSRHMCRIVSSSLAYSAVPCFSTLSHGRQDFRKNITEHIKCVLIFLSSFVWNISRSKKNWARCYWALGVAPQTGESARCKPGARTTTCHRLFGQSNPEPLILVGYSKHTIHNHTQEFVSLQYINTNIIKDNNKENREEQQ